MGLALLVAAALAVAPAGQGGAGERPVVDAVSLELPPGEDAASLQGLLAVRVGEPLSPRDLRRTVLALYRLGRFSNVLVHAVPLPVGPGEAPRVRLVVRCLPRRVVVQVRVVVTPGPPAMGMEAARRAAGLAEGEDLYPGRLEAAAEALRAAYARKGWVHARVEPRAEGDTEARVELRVEEGPPLRVVEVTAGPGAPLERLRIRPGAVLDLDAVDEDVRTLLRDLRDRGYARASVGPPRIDVRAEKAWVDFAVRSGPRITFAFPGATSFSEAELRQHLAIDPELPLDAAAVDASAERLRAFLEGRGFLRARVDPTEGGDEERRTIRFHVEEGRRTRLGEVTFVGQEFRDQQWLRQRLFELLREEQPEEAVPGRVQLDRLSAAGGTPPQQPERWTGPSDPTEHYHEPSWNRAVEGIIERYRSDGFLEASSTGVRLALDARRGVVDVEIRLKEGVRTFVDTISFEGNQRVPLGELARQSKLEPGAPLSLAKVEETRLALSALYARRGFLYARIRASEQYAQDRRSAALRYVVEEGPQVRLGRVLVSGNVRTRESVIRSALELGPGDVYEPEAAAASEAALLGLGVFRSATLRLSDPETAEPVKDLTVEVSERPWQTVVTGVGISTADGPRIFVEYGRPNVFGRALEFVARAKANYPIETFRTELLGRLPAERLEGSLIAGLRYPRPGGLSFGAARLDLIGEHRIQAAYDLTRGALALGFDFARLGRLAARLTYEIEVDWVSTKTGYASAFAFAPVAEAQRLFPVGLTTLHALRPSLSLDFRDNAVTPRKGWYTELTAELAHSLGSKGHSILLGLLPGSETPIDMLKLTGMLTGYLPVGKSVFAAQLRIGRVYPLASDSVTIAPKRFYLGGSTTMRGFGEYEMIPEDRRAAAATQIERCGTLASGLGCSPELRRRIDAGLPPPSEGGEAFLLVKGELRVPLGRSLEAGFFADLGNLWLDPGLLSPRDVRVNAGLGLRVLTPIGPAAIDLGFNIQPHRAINEPVMAPHFTIGFF